MNCYKGKSLECECGDIHCLSDVVIDVGKDIFGNFVEYIAGLEGDKILVFYDLKDEFLLQKLRESDLLKNKDINYIIFPNILPTIELVNKIEDKGQQVVIAIGDENIISFAKYYASCFSNNFCIFPVGEFLDFTFSRFARIFDGVRFNFYDCVAPMAIFVDCSLNKLNDYQTYYLSSKFIAVFDNNLSSSIWEIEYCQRIVDFFKNTLEKYSSRLRQKDSDLNKNNI